MLILNLALTSAWCAKYAFLNVHGLNISRKRLLCFSAKMQNAEAVQISQIFLQTFSFTALFRNVNVLMLYNSNQRHIAIY